MKHKLGGACSGKNGRSVSSLRGSRLDSTSYQCPLLPVSHTTSSKGVGRLTSYNVTLNSIPDAKTISYY